MIENVDFRLLDSHCKAHRVKGLEDTKSLSHHYYMNLSFDFMIEKYFLRLSNWYFLMWYLESVLFYLVIYKFFIANMYGIFAKKSITKCLKIGYLEIKTCTFFLSCWRHYFISITIIFQSILQKLDHLGPAEVISHYQWFIQPDQ